MSLIKGRNALKLSMSILEDWLKKYNPTVNITDGLPILSGVRIYSGNPLEADDSILYIGQASQFDPDQYCNGQIILFNEQDSILIDSEHINSILNDVLEAFEYYNEWETMLKEAAYSNASFQTLIDLSYPVFNSPIFMVDWFGKVLGITSQCEAKMDGTVWNYMRTNGYLPAYVYNVVKVSRDQFQDIERRKEIFYLEIPQFDYQCFHCTVFNEDQPYLNFEISKGATELTEGMRQLAEILRQAVIILIRVSNVGVLKPAAQLLFSDLLSGNFHPEAVRHVLFTLGWEQTENWYLVTFSNPFSGEMSRTVLSQELQRKIPRSFSFEWENQLILVIDRKDWESSLPILKKLLVDGSYCAGVSMPFDRIENLPIGYKQAKLTLSFANPKEVITLCADYAWEYMQNEFVQNFKFDNLYHPAVKKLMTYDIKNGSELSKTFYEYLRNERNMVDTAKKLFIHRNTLRYRLEQINKLIDVNFDDPDARMYLLFSFNLVGQKLESL